MQTIEAIEQRRAVKTYDPGHKMTEQEIEQLLSAAILSPSSFNIQNWRFVVVTDQAQKDKLKEAAWNQAQVSDASIVIVVCADLKAWDKEPARYWQNAPKETQEFLVPMITKFYQGNEQLQRDEAMRSTGIVAQTIMLRAKDMGYDSCPMIGFDPAAVAEIINLPEDHIIGMLLPVGKSIKAAHPRGGQLALKELSVKEQF
ncbi:MAG: nitroreductase family protein [Cyanobacteria bacterium]|nr:nitroreductase family protein [Cyanobacteriota bacterium]MDA1020502.1 nitroreductase family protein [Cyanobacteriota bacterium]